MMAYNHPKWKLTDSIIGVEAKTPFQCPFCHVDMILRRSTMTANKELDFVNPHFDIYYKCPICGLFLGWGVPVPLEYYQTIKRLRQQQGIGRVYAPKDTWQHHELLKKRLETLGYW